MSVPFPSPNARKVAPPSPACRKASTKMFLNRAVRTLTELAVPSRAAVGDDERA
ncbi:uncharacterized protein SCHCODRAFT_011173 [Schizophyllum commune H4-8]|uniref:Expressed protein n=1 Tax=Schizophyllum commune (strain H4-8 / FGSC 9210) TaxID=578458 RepID=D8Q3Z0_SCHCM|nr:uncharacterized protein SCHCODRAFT_011173 [Schizophyllum commune H4-8]KAI5892829.1 hypothetical protein SCHCODRAFT_011173 [Schizophyllum commune H4-8]